MITAEAAGFGWRRLASGLSRSLFVTVFATTALIVAGGGARAQSAPDDQLRLGPLGILTAAPTLVDLGAGVYDLIGNAHRNEMGAVDGEVRFGQRWNGIGPAAGTIVDFRGGGMVYAGIDSDRANGPIIVTPFAGLGDGGAAARAMKILAVPSNSACRSKPPILSTAARGSGSGLAICPMPIFTS